MNWLFTVFTIGMEFGEYIILLIGTGSIVIAALAYLTSTKQFHHGVMTSCITRFQQIIQRLDDTSEEKSDTLREYIDLCNEELFYFKNDYIPKEVAIEWVDGMLHYLPLIDRDGEFFDSWKYEEGITKEMIRKYPRICAALQVKQPPIINDPYSRMNCILEILQNVGNYKFGK